MITNATHIEFSNVVISLSLNFIARSLLYLQLVPTKNLRYFIFLSLVKYLRRQLACFPSTVNLESINSLTDKITNPKIKDSLFSVSFDAECALQISPWSDRFITNFLSRSSIQIIDEVIRHQGFSTLNYFTAKSCSAGPYLSCFYGSLYELAFSTSSSTITREYIACSHPLSNLIKMANAFLCDTRIFIETILLHKLALKAMLIRSTNTISTPVDAIAINSIPIRLTRAIGVGDVLFDLPYYQQYWPSFIHSFSSARPDFLKTTKSLYPQ